MFYKDLEKKLDIDSEVCYYTISIGPESIGYPNHYVSHRYSRTCPT